MTANSDGCGPGGNGGAPSGIVEELGGFWSPCDDVSNGIAIPIPGIVPSFRFNPANDPGGVGGSGPGKLIGMRPARAGFCSLNPS